MSAFGGAFFDDTSRLIDTHLADCHVTIGNSATWASRLARPLAAGIDGSVFEPGENVRLPGLFEDAYEAFLEDIEGRSITLDMETLVSTTGGPHAPTLKHGARLLIEPMRSVPYPPFIHEVQRVEPDGKGRSFITLQVLGPSCAHVNTVSGGPFPYTLPIILGAAAYRECVVLDVVP